MKNYKNEIICPSHKQPIIKIDTISKRLFCHKCESETPDQKRKRIQILRAKLNSAYIEELNKLKSNKMDVQNLADMFISHNMVEAKRKLKKQLPAIQKIVNQLLEREVDEANKILKNYIEKVLKPWNSIDGRKFDLLYLEFEKSYPEILQNIDSKKKQLKETIAQKVKGEIRELFIKIFNF